MIQFKNLDESVWNIVVEKKQNKSWLYVEKYNIWKSLCYTEQNFYYKHRNCLLCLHEGRKSRWINNADTCLLFYFMMCSYRYLKKDLLDTQVTGAECSQRGWRVLGWVRDGMWSSSPPNLHNFSATKYPESRRGFNKENAGCTQYRTQSKNTCVHKKLPANMDSAAFYCSVAPVALSSNIYCMYNNLRTFEK